MKNFAKISVILGLALLVAAQSFAEDKAAKELKIGTADLYKIFAGYYKTVESKEELEKKAERKNEERDRLAEEIKKLKEEALLLSSAERAKKEEVIMEKSKTLLDFDRETRENLDRESDNKERDLLLEIGRGVEGYGRNNGFDLILDSRTVFYAGDRLDISGEILEGINKKK